MTNEKSVLKSILGLRGAGMINLSKKMGKSPNWLASMVNNKSSMTLDTLLTLMNELGCEVIVKDKLGTRTVWKLERVEEE